MTSLLDTPTPPAAPPSVRKVTKLNASAPVGRDDADVETPPPPKPVARTKAPKRGRESWTERPDCFAAIALRVLQEGPLSQAGLIDRLQWPSQRTKNAIKRILNEGMASPVEPRRRRDNVYALTAKGALLAEELDARTKTPLPRRRPVVDTEAPRKPVASPAGSAACESNTGSRRGPVADMGPPSSSAAVSRHLQEWFAAGIFVVGMRASHVMLAIPIERITDASIGGLINLET